jgi:TldD protein
MLDLLRRAIESVTCTYADIRYQERELISISVSKGELEEVNASETTGVGIRVLKNGSWGFASVNSTKSDELLQAAKSAERIAELTAAVRRTKSEGLAEARLAKGIFSAQVRGRLEDVTIEEKMDTVVEAEKLMRSMDERIISARCSYNEIIDRKFFASSDGGWFEMYDSKPEFRTAAVCMSGGEAVIGMEATGVTGGWKDLFSKMDPLKTAETSVKKAVRLLEATHLKGGRDTVILDPSLVGLISHEAVGHTVEADFVKSGSAAKQMMGKRVASELVTLVDSGASEYASGAAGTLPVDDEGVLSRKVEIIKRGVMTSYLHDRETAKSFNAEPTGNARAFSYSDEPIIRMRNTYIEPGDWKLDELIGDTKHGYLLTGALNGEADANAEFMFAIEEAREIIDGSLGKLYRGVTISGSAFEALSTVDAITRDFQWDMGSGYCGKGQLAKVDGGGGHLRCKVLLGGR